MTLSVSGVVTDGGSSPVTVRGVFCGLTTEPTTVTGRAVAAGAGTGAFTVGLTGLQPVTPYYVRAFATNAVGKSYGATVSVMTLAVPVVLPQFTTSVVTGLTPLSATAGGEVVQDGGAVVTARGVVYGASPSPTLPRRHDGLGWPVNTLAWYYDDSLRNTHAASQLQANALGLYDMHGSVWEWCWDDFAAYTAMLKVRPSHHRVQSPAPGRARGQLGRVRQYMPVRQPRIPICRRQHQ